MMYNPKMICSKEVSDLYDELNKQYRYMINMKDENQDNLRYVACKLREEFSKLGYSDEMIADMLVEYLYHGGKRYKQLLWFCYGQYIVNNLGKHIEVQKTKYVQCDDCDEWIEVDIKDNITTRCPSCYAIYRKKYKAEKERERRLRSKSVDNTN